MTKRLLESLLVALLYIIIFWLGAGHILSSTGQAIGLFLVVVVAYLIGSRNQQKKEPLTKWFWLWWILIMVVAVVIILGLQ
jgi:magnesium-transporting ATPase (P-type)